MAIALPQSFLLRFSYFCCWPGSSIILTNLARNVFFSFGLQLCLFRVFLFLKAFLAETVFIKTALSEFSLLEPLLSRPFLKNSLYWSFLCWDVSLKLLVKFSSAWIFFAQPLQSPFYQIFFVKLSCQFLYQNFLHLPENIYKKTFVISFLGKTISKIFFLRKCLLPNFLFQKFFFESPFSSDSCKFCSMKRLQNPIKKSSTSSFSWQNPLWLSLLCKTYVVKTTFVKLPSWHNLKLIELPDHSFKKNKMS